MNLCNCPICEQTLEIIHHHPLVPVQPRTKVDLNQSPSCPDDDDDDDLPKTDQSAQCCLTARDSVSGAQL